MSKILPVILSGGSGTRLWPASRSMYPKELLPLVRENTMLQDTALRLEGVRGLADHCLIVCNESHRFLVAEQLRTAGCPAQVLLEPEGRNTAPAVALAAMLSPDSILLVMPADHVIANVQAFHAALAHAVDAAESGKLVILGIVPDSAETGYGYINAHPNGTTAAPVLSLVERPDAETAEKYVASGQYFWNSGMFVFRARAYLDALQTFAPEIHAACEASMANRCDGGEFIRPDKAAFLNCPSDSIDYAVMEKTDAAVMVPLNAGWSDVGSWEALHASRSCDADGNATSGDVLMNDCKNTYIQAESRLIAAVGLNDLVVVETKDAMLIARKSKSQDVKVLVDRLEELGREETKLHRQVFRPWGSYDSLENLDGFQVKRLIVSPGAVLSLQKHAHRAEHWVVVRGKARVTRNEDVIDLGVNESIYIAIGDVHRIANPFAEEVHIIEVQCGDYLGEDDIVRLEDNYGREGTNT